MSIACVFIRVKMRVGMIIIRMFFLFIKKLEGESRNSYGEFDEKGVEGRRRGRGFF